MEQWRCFAKGKFKEMQRRGAAIGIAKQLLAGYIISVKMSQEVHQKRWLSYIPLMVTFQCPKSVHVTSNGHLMMLNILEPVSGILYLSHEKPGTPSILQHDFWYVRGRLVCRIRKFLCTISQALHF
jgi:hypothetical protein